MVMRDLVSGKGAPSQSHLGKVTGPQHNRVQFVGFVEEKCGAVTRLDILEHDILFASMSQVFKLGSAGAADIYLCQN